MKKPKIIFLDWSGTLSSSRFWEQLAGPLHPRHSWLPKFEDSLFENLKHVLCPWMRGKYTSEEVCRMVAQDTGADYETLLEDFIKSCQLMKLASRQSLETLERIRNKGNECVIATDNMDSFRRWTIPALNLEKHFDGFLISWELKCLKADFENGQSKFFADYLKSKALDFEDCVLLDDDADELGIYSRLGMSYIQISSAEDLVKKLEKLTLLSI